MENQKHQSESQSHKGPPTAVVVEFGEGKEGKTPDRHGLTGEPIPNGVNGEVVIKATEWKKFLEDEAKDAEQVGDFEKAARLRGANYSPSFGEAAYHTLIKMKSATITVLLAAATPLALILVWEGIRLVIPRARTLPGFIKYKPADEKPAKVVRLAAR